MELNFHLTDDRVDDYVLGRLSGAELAELEEHLILCSECRARLDTAEAFAAGMKEASVLNPTTSADSAPRPKWTDWRRKPAVSMGLAFVAVLAVVSIFSNRQTSFMPVAALTLSANRGETPATGPALELDLTLTDAPRDAGVFRVEVVNAAGQTVWSGLAPGTETGVQVKAKQRLPPGNYFVRLHAVSGEVLREYGFRIQ